MASMGEKRRVPVVGWGKARNMDILGEKEGGNRGVDRLAGGQCRGGEGGVGCLVGAASL